MTLDHLRIATDWAAAEGWNPGLEDAAAFHAVDPTGFLMSWLDDIPVAAISVVRHSADFGFLGFYLCQPDHRGKGYGMATWHAGMAYLGARTVGLDGVPAQEENYERSGFALSHYSRRYAGRVAGAAHPDCRLTTAADLPVLLDLDRQICGTRRVAYMSAWFHQTRTRKTVVCEEEGSIRGVGTIRTCREGHKIGPLFAKDAKMALRLIEALVETAGGRDVQIDVPDPNKPGVDLAAELGLKPVFSCARMYRLDPLVRRLDCVFGETTFELG